jgi:macrodomain Ter protein organizer (MatP/YcbG family)
MPKEGYKSAGTIKIQSYKKLEEIAKAKHMTVSEAIVFLIDEYSKYLETQSVFAKPEGSS